MGVIGMRTALRWSAAVLAGLTASIVTPAAPARASGYSAPLRTAIADLAVAAENRSGYDRHLFPHWIDADGDGCNTRYEVLIAEAVTAPSVSDPCVPSGGRWYSYVDNRYWTAPSDLDIDHFVPLAEAWDSGARAWPTTRRRAFANDLGDPRSLAAVTDDVNQAKGDRDPAAWMPPYSGARCRYVAEWVAVKTRWRLTVDTTEKNALRSHANSCANITVTVTHAG
jgi:Protein of unknown function (DUF1524)